MNNKYSERALKLQTEIDEIQDQIDTLQNKKLLLREEVKVEYKKTFDGETDWSVLLEIHPYESNYDALDLKIEELQSIRLSGFYDKYTEQFGLETRFSSDPKKFRKQKAFFKREIAELLPHIKPDEDGWKRVSLFEDTLSRSGTFHIGFDGDTTDAILFKSVHGRLRSETKLWLIDDVLDYIHKNHPYD